MSEQPLKIVKRGYTMPMSWEKIWYGPSDFLTPRKVKSKKFIPADKEERKAFKKWKEAYDAITAEGYERGWYSDGYEGPEIDEPNGHWEYEYEED